MPQAHAVVQPVRTPALTSPASAGLQEEVREVGEGATEPVRQVLQGMVENLPAAVQAAADDGTLDVRSNPPLPADEAAEVASVDWDSHRAALRQQLQHLQQVRHAVHVEQSALMPASTEQ